MPLGARAGTQPDFRTDAQLSLAHQEHAAAAPDEGRVWLLGEFEIPSAYFFRGFALERHGFIAQPAARLGVDVWRFDDGPVQRVSALVGARGSFHSRQTGAVGAGPANWFEADLIGGLQLGMFDRLQAELLYAAITSPNGAFPTIEEIGLNIDYSDRGLWPGDFSLDPYAHFKFEIANSAAGGPEGVLMQLGMAPGFSPFGAESLPLRLSFPVEVGISLDDYYYLPAPIDQDNTFGYAKVGVSLAMPMFFLPQDYGQWLVTIGADYLHLGDNLQAFNRGRDHDTVARLTVNFKY